MLYMIGLGLSDEKDITLKGLEAIKKSDYLYLETYTSKLSCSVEKLEELYGKKIIPADRNFVEEGKEIINNAKNGTVSFLVIGDVFGATTHVELFQRAKAEGVDVQVINNTSIINAVSITGLELYKFGRIVSIPFHNESVEAPYIVLKQNQDQGLHTLFLLDLNPKEGKYMTINDGIKYLSKLEEEKKERAFTNEIVCIGCARLGSDNFIIKTGTSEELVSFDFGAAPHCLIVPGKLHFVEEEAIGTWK